MNLILIHNPYNLPPKKKPIFATKCEAIPQPKVVNTLHNILITSPLPPQIVTDGAEP